MSAVQSAPAPVAIGPAPPPHHAALPATRRSDALAPVHRFGMRLSNEWLPRAAWAVGRTGRPGFVGIALLAATMVFFGSTHLKVAQEVQSLEADLAAARIKAATVPRVAADDPAQALKSLPTRTEMPAILGVLLKQADAAHLTLDTGKYEISATKTASVTRYRLSFPVTGPYPQVRQFIDSTLKSMPAVAISDLSFERKTIADPNVEAQVRMTVFTRSAP